MRLVLGFLLLALPAAAQLDSYTLRAKFGAPLNRETFDLPQGLELTVDYGAGNQVCKMEVHALPPRENRSGPSNPTQEMQNFLLDLVPASMRGKELGKFAGMTGAFSSFSGVEYEHVTVSQPAHSVGNETILVSFKNDDCR
jgi:hypothetical protein